MYGRGAGGMRTPWPADHPPAAGTWAQLPSGADHPPGKSGVMMQGPRLLLGAACRFSYTELALSSSFAYGDL